MTILKKLKNYLSSRAYQKYRRKSCLKCGILNWKYSFAPYIQNGKKGTLEARICGNCGYKDPKGHFISDEIKLDKNLKFNIKQ